MRKLTLAQLLDQQYQLPDQKDFVMNLQNNGYSLETIYNYNRDLSFFAHFLQDHEHNGLGEALEFKDSNKNTITFYKGWLKERHHVHRRSKNPNTKQQKEESKTAQMIDLNAPTDNSLDAQAQKMRYKLGGGMVKNNNPDELDARSINRILSSLRNYLRFLIEMDIPAPLPPDAIKLVRAKRKKPQIPELEEILKLVEAPTQFEPKEHLALRNRAMLETLMASGMRISELVSLRREQLNDEGKLLIFGKGNKQRFVYLTPRSMEHIKNYLLIRTDPYPALFVPYSGRRLAGSDPKISTNYVQMKIAHYRRLLGIVIPTSAHTIRHGFATYLAENGANPAAIQILLGHESLQTTTRYVHASDKFAEETHHEFHPVQN